MDIFFIIKDYAQTILTVGVIAALLISFFTLITQRRHNDYERLVEVYKMINDFDKREARKSVYTAYRIYMGHYYNDGLKIGGKTHTLRISLQRIKARSSLTFSETPQFCRKCN